MVYPGFAEKNRMNGTWRDEWRALLALALPLSLTQLSQVVLGTGLLWLAAQDGAMSLAVMGLAMVLFNQLRTMGVGLITPTGNLVATALARGEAEQAVRRHLLAGLWLATLAGGFGLLVLCLAGWWLPYLGQDEALLRPTLPVLALLAPGLLPCLWFQVLRQYAVGRKQPGPVLLMTLLGCAFTLLLGYGLLHGAGSLTGRGLAGVALAGTLGHVFALALFAFWQRSLLFAGLGWQAWRPDFTAMAALWRLGLPVALTYGSEAGFFMLITLLVGSLGADALAAHSAVNQLVYIAFMVSVGFSHAASIRISESVARQQFADCRRIAVLALLTGWVFCALLALVYSLFPQWVLALFMRESAGAVYPLAASLLLLAMWLQFFDSWQNIAVGLLRGQADTVSSFRLSTLAYWGAGLPLAWWLSQAHGLAGVWYGLIAGLVLASLLMLRQFFRALPATATLQAEAA